MAIDLTLGVAAYAAFVSTASVAILAVQLLSDRGRLELHAIPFLDGRGALRHDTLLLHVTNVGKRPVVISAAMFRVRGKGWVSCGFLLPSEGDRPPAAVTSFELEPPRHATPRTVVPEGLISDFCVVDSLGRRYRPPLISRWRLIRFLRGNPALEEHLAKSSSAPPDG